MLPMLVERIVSRDTARDRNVRWPAVRRAIRVRRNCRRLAHEARVRQRRAGSTAMSL